jgi:hypothetical protein
MADKKLKVKSLMAAIGSENQLARKHIESIEQDLPAGHPLEQNIAMEKAKMNGDLSGLPPNHPLIVAMEEAHERYRKNEEQQEISKVKKAKKISFEEKKKKIADESEEAKKIQINSIKAINSGISKLMTEMDELFGVIGIEKEKLNNDFYLQTRLKRLERLIMASQRGLAECRFRNL